MTIGGGVGPPGAAVRSRRLSAAKLNPRGWGSTFTSLSERDYAWYFAGNLAFFMAMQMQMILRGFLAYDLAGTVTALGFVSASIAIPMLIVAPFGGTVADRVNKRTLLMVSQAGSAVAAVLVTALILADMIEFWHLLVVSLVTGSIMSFNMPARQAIVPQLVPQHKLMNAISLQQAGMNVTRILGPALAGLLIAPFGVGWAYAVTAVLFTIAVVAELHLPRHGMKAAASGQRFREDFLGGFKYIKDHSLIALLLSLGLVFPLFGFPLQQMLPVFAKDVFNDPEGTKGVLGLLGMATGVGGLTGAMLAANLHSFPMKGRLMLAGGLWMGTLFIAFTFMSSFIPALILLALGNIGGMVFQTTNQTVIQAHLPAEVRGRVMSVTMMSFGLMPLGVLPVTFAADRVGPEWAVAGSSAALVLTMVVFFSLSRRLRTLRVDPLAQTELSPAQAAKLVSEGRLTQDEADRMSGSARGVAPVAAVAAGPIAREATPVAPTAPPAPLSPPEPRPEPEPVSAPLVPVPALASAPAAPTLGLAAAGTPAERAAAPAPGWSGVMALWRAARRPVVLGSAFAVGMVLGFAASGSGELLRAVRGRLAAILDPDD